MTSQKIGGKSWIIFLGMMIVVGFMLTGGANILTKQNKAISQEKSYLIPEDISNTDSNKSLQLRKIGFTEVKTINSDCGHGDVKGVNEYFVLWAIDPGPGQFAGQGGSIKAFYSDEWPLTLGAGNVSKLMASPDHIINPKIGDVTKKDKNGFPYFPALFISDITDDPNNHSGDSQNGGKAYPPDEIYGTWQPLNVQPKALKPNKLDLGQGADVFPTQSNLWKMEGRLKNGPPEIKYGAEIIWEVDKLGLINGRIYRAQIVLHDGDREGDIGQACTSIKY